MYEDGKNVRVEAVEKEWVVNLKSGMKFSTEGNVESYCEHRIIDLKDVISVVVEDNSFSLWVNDEDWGEAYVDDDIEGSNVYCMVEITNKGDKVALHSGSFN